VSPAVLGAPVSASAPSQLTTAPHPLYPLTGGPECSSRTINWKFAAPAGSPDGFPSVAIENTARNGFNKWLGTGLKTTSGASIYSLTETASAAFKVYYRELDGIPGLGPNALGAYSCQWHSVYPDVPLGVPALVMDPSSLTYGTTIFTHEMGHTLGLNHAGRYESLNSGTAGSGQSMNTCVSFPFNQALGRDDYAQSQYRRTLNAQTANPGFETTSVGWDLSNAQIATNSEAGQGANTLHLNAGTGRASTAVRIEPRKGTVLMAARFKGSAGATAGGRFKWYYRERYIPYVVPATPPADDPCELAQFYQNLDLNNPVNSLPAFTLYFSQDFNLTTSWSSLPNLTGGTAVIPSPTPVSTGLHATDFKIEAQNMSSADMWIDSFFGVAV